MKKYNEQIERIKSKLSEAKATDRKLKVFGASSHKYLINPPATLSEIENFEAKYNTEHDGIFLLVKLYMLLVSISMQKGIFL